MSRLLFAAARGARIQVSAFTKVSPLWYPTKKWSAMHESVLRIHPDDAHLAYGPISTALREIALTGDYADNTIPYIIFEIERETGYWTSTLEQRCVFLLILAEALAEEGL